MGMVESVERGRIGVVLGTLGQQPFESNAIQYAGSAHSRDELCLAFGDSHDQYPVVEEVLDLCRELGFFKMGPRGEEYISCSEEGATDGETIFASAGMPSDTSPPCWAPSRMPPTMRS